MNEYQITEAVKTEAVVRLAEMYPIDSNHRAPIVESGWTVLAILEKAASEPCHRAEYGWQGDCANIQDSGPDMHYACGRCIARAFLKELAGQAEEQEQAVANKQPGVGYPMDWRTHLLGPTLFYIDEAGTPIELRLTNDQVKMIVDDWNSGPDDSEPGYVPAMLKPPCVDAEQNIDELDAEQIERIEIEDGRRCGECGSTEMGHCVYCKMD